MFKKPDDRPSIPGAFAWCHMRNSSSQFMDWYLWVKSISICWTQTRKPLQKLHSSIHITGIRNEQVDAQFNCMSFHLCWICSNLPIRGTKANHICPSSFWLLQIDEEGRRRIHVVSKKKKKTQQVQTNLGPLFRSNVRNSNDPALSSPLLISA